MQEKELAALENLEQTFSAYFQIVCGEAEGDIGINANKSVEARLLYLAYLLDSVI